MIRLPNKFKNTSILLPVLDEDISLKKTIQILINDNRKFIKNIFLIIDKKKTIKKSQNLCHFFSKRFKIIKIVYQKTPKLGGAFRDAIKYIKSSHCIIMCSDLETDPKTVRKLIIQSRRSPNYIIQASRWIGKNNFYNYGIIKVVMNFFFQKIFSFLFRVNCSDLTFGFRILPTILLKSFKWEMNDHSFVFESNLKPIISGTKIRTIKTKWKKRIEGEGHNQIFNYYKYLFIGIKLFVKYKMFTSFRNNEKIYN